MPALLVNHELATVDAVRQFDVQTHGRDPVVSTSIHKDRNLDLRESVPNVKARETVSLAGIDRLMEL